jgi:hypothetical protein
MISKITTMNNTTSSDISYEFYYLLRTQIEKAEQLVREPRRLSAITEPSISQEGFLIDTEKRLFRYDSLTTQAENDLTDEEPQSMPLDEWPKHLKKGWDKIQRQYIEYFATQGIDASQAQAFCSDALLGVALLINDASLESHRITVPLRTSGDSTVSQVVFIPDTWLLHVVHTPPEDSSFGRMPEPAILAQFEPQFLPIQQDKYWQLLLELPIPQLAPMEIAANTSNPSLAANPVFAVYGIAHGEAMLNTNEWPLPALLVRLLPRLLMREWQFLRMDLAARQVLKYLQARSHLYRQAQLACLSHHQLVNELQAMAELRADTALLLRQLHQAIKTLEVHQHHSERRLRRAYKASPQWKVIWQYEGEAPLLDSFDVSQQTLHNHINDIETELTYLDGIGQKWHLQFEALQQAWRERLGSLGIFLASLVVISTATLMAVGIQSHDNHSFLSRVVQLIQEIPSGIADIFMLSQPIVYGLLVLILLLPMGWLIGKTWFQKIRCHRIWRWGSLSVLLLAVGYFGIIILT